MNPIQSKDEFIQEEAEYFLDYLEHNMDKENRTSFNIQDVNKLKKWFLCTELDAKKYEQDK